MKIDTSRKKMDELQFRNAMDEYSRVEQLVTHMENTIDAVIQGRRKELKALEAAAESLQERLPHPHQKEIAKTLLTNLHSIM